MSRAGTGDDQYLSSGQRLKNDQALSAETAVSAQVLTNLFRS
jgi:hypothetical protein